ncbi:transcription factor TFIIH complex subunit Tfb5-domain-containing protein [Pilobolus umbonatus]|nr:transcription factor TFIIH complex subunit Tfb5-domain-containing protein [Pilobolus umbonatus]
MVKAVKGVLLECDSTVKQILLNLNKRDNFIVEDLDETHLFIESSWVDKLKYELDKILDENSYTVTTEEPQEGALVCQYGHQYHGFQTEVGDEDAMKGRTRKKQRVMHTEQEIYTEQTSLVYCIQYALQVLSRAMVQELGVPAQYEHVVRELWMVYLSKTKKIVSNEYRYVGPAEPEPDSMQLEEDAESDTEEVLAEPEPQRKEHFTRQKIKYPSLIYKDCLVFLYLGALYLGLPLLPKDIIYWCLSGQLPYCELVKKIPNDIMSGIGYKQAVNMSSPGAPFTMSYRAIKYARAFHDQCQLKFPDWNISLYLRRFCNEMYLPVEAYYLAKAFQNLRPFKPDKNIGVTVLENTRSLFNYLTIAVVTIVNVLYGLDDDEEQSTRCSPYNLKLSKKAYLSLLQRKLDQSQEIDSLVQLQEHAGLVKRLKSEQVVIDRYQKPNEKSFVLKGFGRILYRQLERQLSRPSSFTYDWVSHNEYDDDTNTDSPVMDEWYLYKHRDGFRPECYQLVIRAACDVSQCFLPKLLESMLEKAQATVISVIAEP